MMMMSHHRPDDGLALGRRGHAKGDERWPGEYYTRALVAPRETPPSLKRCRSMSDEDSDEFRAHDWARVRAHAPTTEESSRIPYTYTPAIPSTASNIHLLVSQWSAEPDGWQKDCLDEIALLAEIEEQAATYASGGVELLAPFLLGERAEGDEMAGRGPGGQDKPFKCALCPKSFTRNYDLTRHKSSHEDERPHVCRHCGRSFNRRDALSRHNLVRGCGGAFSQTAAGRRPAQRARPPVQVEL